MRTGAFKPQRMKKRYKSALLYSKSFEAMKATCDKQTEIEE